MKLIPLPVSPYLVTKICNGTKTVTRRTRNLKHINQNPDEWRLFSFDGTKATFENKKTLKLTTVKNPYGQPGDVLWVRENFRAIEQETGGFRYEYQATEKINVSGKWKPSIHFPFIACRLFMPVLSVSLERLHNITEQEALAEGIENNSTGHYKNYCTKQGLSAKHGVNCFSPIASFKTLWIEINSPESWDLNPWVWVVRWNQTASVNPLANR